ncbi:collagen-binding domain-containing protein [Clostridium baratii]|uniref:collagen-binding domain-containing protein n=1 Tax=Clostridium baratii TaxID=1561 RepID=UPI0030CF2EC4
MRKSLKKALTYITIFIFISCNVFSITGNATTKNNGVSLGDLAHYNGIIFNNAYVKNSRVEGPMAVRGNIVLNTNEIDNFGICASASKGAESSLIGNEYVDNNEPSLLLGGDIINNTPSNTHNIQVFSNPIVIRKDAKASTVSALKNSYESKTINEVESKEIKSKFEEYRNKVNSFIGDIKTLKLDNNKIDTLKYHDQDRQNYYQNENIYKVLNDKVNSLYCKLPYNNDTLNVSEINLPEAIGNAKNDDVKFLILYSDATNVNFKNGGTYYNPNYAVNKSDIQNGMVVATPNNKTLKSLASKIIWVLPNAKTVTSDGAVIGSVMAPNATLNTDGGDIIGQVIVNNFNQRNGGNFCNAIFDWKNFDDSNNNESNNDILNINKTAEYDSKDANQSLNNREYTIKLQASVKKDIVNEAKPKDIILVLDTSGSMRGDPEKNLISSAKTFSKKVLENPKNKIATVTFAAKSPYITDIDYYYVKNGKRFYRGYFDYYKDGEKTEVLIDPSSYKREYYYNYYTGYINYGSKDQKEVLVQISDDWKYAVVVSGIPNDAQILNNFTNNIQDIYSKLNRIGFGGGTNTQAAIAKIDELLQSVKNDSSREKYVIFFTDGMPNMLVDSKDRLYDEEYTNRTIDSFNKIFGKDNSTKFISLGFKSDTLIVNKNTNNSTVSSSEKLLKALGKNNSEMGSICKDGIIYIEKPEDIGKIYNDIYEKISSNVSDAKITDIVPDNFEIVKGSEYPKGATLNGNTIVWDNQLVGESTKEFTFKIKAKDTFAGNMPNDLDYINKPGQIATNTKATIEYTNPIKNNKVVQEFPIPKVNVPNSYKLELKNKTVLYGDRVKLSDLINKLEIKYGPKDGYKYTWTDDKGNKIVLDNEQMNALSGNNFEKDSKDYGIVMKDDTTYTLEITNDNIPNFDLKSSGKVTVLKPTIHVTKKVIDKNGKPVDSDGVFSFNINQEYNGNEHVYLNKQEWNADVLNNNTFIIKNVVRGTYNFRERDSHGYTLKDIKINGKSVDINNCNFEVSLNKDKVEVNNIAFNSKEPVINIEITNVQNEIDFENSTNVITNNFNEC